TPNLSSGIGRLPPKFLCRRCDRSDDIGVAGAAADIAGEPLTDLTFRSRALPQDQIARGDQHCRSAVAALQRVMLVKTPTQRIDHAVARKAFDRRDLALVAGDREQQARARRLAVDEDGAGAADTMFAAQMSAGQIAPLAQKIRERQSRRHVIRDMGTVDLQADRSHCSTCCTARIAATVWRLRWNSSKCRSVARSRSAATAPRIASRPFSETTRDACCSTSGA